MRRLTQIYEWDIKLRTLSPLRIGDGDNDVLLDQYHRPFIPGTSLAGAFRSYLKNSQYTYLLSTLFGEKSSYRPKEGLLFTDAFLEGDYRDSFRPGVRISGKTKTVEEGAYFERHFIAPGASFRFKLTLMCLDEENQEQWKAVTHLLYALHHGGIHLGAQTSIGGGRVEIESCLYNHYDCNQLDDLEAYVHQTKKPKPFTFTEDFQPESRLQFLIKAKTATPLLIASHKDYDSRKADAIYMKNEKGQAYIPGSSLKGVLRHGVERIINALSLKEGHKYVESIFGQYHNHTSHKARAASIQFQDTLLTNCDGKNVTYYRIAINPLTGGNKDGALLNEETIEGNFDIKIDLFYSEKDEHLYVAGALLLFALRDLALKDLSLGSRASIGYGFIDVEEIEVQLEEKRLLLSIEEEKIEDPGGLLNLFDQALNRARQSSEVGKHV